MIRIGTAHCLGKRPAATDKLQDLGTIGTWILKD